MYTIGTPFLWKIFSIFIIIILIIDLSIQNFFKKEQFYLAKSFFLSIGWILTTLIFNILLWMYLDHTTNRSFADKQSLIFLTCYLLEKSLSVDNLFVWMMLFSYFSIPVFIQQKLLTYGIVSTIILRMIMIFSGTLLLNKFKLLLYLFGIFLIFTGIRIFSHRKQKTNFNKNSLICWFYRNFRVSKNLYGERFFIQKNGITFITPLLLVLIMIEISNVVFSFDSVPAIFSITVDPFIILTSNLFAIIGLRSMYVILANITRKIIYIQHGLSAILIFTGVKMLITDYMNISEEISLSIIATILFTTLVCSFLKKLSEKV